jgi:mono/diheme cytochrome c family protein
MPPFAHILNDEQVAALVTYIRVAWENSGTPVAPAQVNELRSLLPE